MFLTMPWSLIVAFVLYAAIVRTHHGYAAIYEGRSEGFNDVLIVFSILGYLAGAGLLIYYWTQTAWYWALILLFLASAGGAAIFWLLESQVGMLWLTFFCFLGWPITGYWIYHIIRNLNH